LNISLRLLGVLCVSAVEIYPNPSHAEPWDTNRQAEAYRTPAITTRLCFSTPSQYNPIALRKNIYNLPDQSRSGSTIQAFRQRSAFLAIRLSRNFILRKLHQLSGIVPLGLFLLEHFYTNSKALTGAGDFNKAVVDLQSIPYILFVEIGGIFIPLIYHAVYGMVITVEARPNNLAYPYPRNWFYLVQRITGVILFFFITFHVLNFRLE
jgi:succinate dehydrogenase/fumarate reductase cytochrome b subunit